MTLSDTKQNTQALENMELFSKAECQLVALHKTIKTVTDTTALKSVLAYANYDGALFKVVPSLESINTDTDFDRQAALEGIFDKIKDTASKWWLSFKEHLVDYKQWYTLAVSLLAGVIGGKISDKITGSNLPKAAKFFITTFVVSAATSNVVGFLINIKSIPTAIHECLGYSLPTEHDAYILWYDKVKKTFKSHSGIDIEASSSVDKYGNTKTEMTTQQVVAYANEIRAVATELKKAGYIADRLEQLAKSKEGQTSTGRKALTILTSLSSKYMKEAVDIIVKSDKNVEHGVKTAK
jgi:hypothetical protein